MPSARAPALISQQHLLDARLRVRDWRLFQRRQASSLLLGGSRSRSRGRGMDFDEVRLYQPGDDVRSIDWRVTARRAEPHTKLFRSERERPVMLLVDLRPPMLFGSQRSKASLAAEIAALIGWAAVAGNDRLGALVFGPAGQADVRPGSGHRAALRLIRELLSVQAQLRDPLAPSPLSLAAMLEEARRIARPGQAWFVVSDGQDFDQAAEKQLALLRRHCDVHGLLVHDPLEQHLPRGRWTLTDGQRRLPLAVDDRWQQAQRDHFLHRRAAWQRTSQALGIPVALLSTADDPATALQPLYGRRR